MSRAELVSNLIRSLGKFYDTKNITITGYKLTDAITVMDPEIQAKVFKIEIEYQEVNEVSKWQKKKIELLKI